MTGQRPVPSAEPQRSSAEFFAAPRSRESKQSRHILQSREEAGHHTAPAQHNMLSKFLDSFKGNNNGRTSTSLKPSLADCAAAGAVEDAARLTAGTMA
jgi:hypothetical protein